MIREPVFAVNTSLDYQQHIVFIVPRLNILSCKMPRRQSEKQNNTKIIHSQYFI